jgi:hypothetical protein
MREKRSVISSLTFSIVKGVHNRNELNGTTGGIWKIKWIESKMLLIATVRSDVIGIRVGIVFTVMTA